MPSLGNYLLHKSKCKHFKSFPRYKAIDSKKLKFNFPGKYKNYDKSLIRT